MKYLEVQRALVLWMVTIWCLHPCVNSGDSSAYCSVVFSAQPSGALPYIHGLAFSTWLNEFLCRFLKTRLMPSLSLSLSLPLSLHILPLWLCAPSIPAATTTASLKSNPCLFLSARRPSNPAGQCLQAESQDAGRDHTLVSPLSGITVLHCLLSNACKQLHVFCPVF